MNLCIFVVLFDSAVFVIPLNGKRKWPIRLIKRLLALCMILYRGRTGFVLHFRIIPKTSLLLIILVYFFISFFHTPHIPLLLDTFPFS